MIVAAANEMVFLFVGLELVSMPTYIILYLSRRNPTTQEAAMKYFFLSIFASGLLLYGLTFLYGTTGVSNLKALAYFFDKLPNLPHPQLGLVAVVFVTAGLCFRVAAVPLHFYAPDVYQGSPMVVAATLAWIPKFVGFLAIVRTLTAVFSVKGGEDPLVQKAVIALVDHRGRDDGLGKLSGTPSGGPQAIDGVFLDRACRVHDGGGDGRARERSPCRRHILRVRERLLLPGDLRADDAWASSAASWLSSSRTGRSRRSTISRAWAGRIPGRLSGFRSVF